MHAHKIRHIGCDFLYFLLYLFLRLIAKWSSIGFQKSGINFSQIMSLAKIMKYCTTHDDNASRRYQGASVTLVDYEIIVLTIINTFKKKIAILYS